MSAPVIVLGAGGHGRVILDALLSAGVPVAGIVDPDPALAGATVLGVPVLGGDEAVQGFPAAAVRLACGVGSVAVAPKRRELFDLFASRGYSFVTVIHPSAVVAREVEIGEGAQLMAVAVLQTGTRIGRNAIVNTRAVVDHDCVVGDHAHLAPGVTLSGGVTVGEGTHIGTGATVIHGVKIGRGCLVGAGALVLKDVADGETVYGVPAKVVAR